MSRAFTKEDAGGGPVHVPDRAPLPQGATNYVTPNGLALMSDELAELERLKSDLSSGDSDDHDRIRELTVVNGRLSKLRERLDTARVVDPADQPEDEIRFGATVELEAHSSSRGSRRLRFQIVGVDEAASESGVVAFTAPIARAIIGVRPGDTVEMPPGLVWDRVRVLSVSY